MTRRTPAKGVTPFEFRTGIGGLPALGGMYRSGDPATIPPHKLHLGVNVRITPGGMISRPGLAEEYDTTVDECIDGITDGDPVPQGLLLYGATASGVGGGSWWTGSPSIQPALFRVVSKKWDVDYSELFYVLHGATDLTDGADQPTLVLDNTSDPLNCWLESYPFVLNGRIMAFVHADRLTLTGATVRALGLVEIDLPLALPGFRVTDCYTVSDVDPGTYYVESSFNPTLAQSCNRGLSSTARWPWGMDTARAHIVSWIPDLEAWATSADTWEVMDWVSCPESFSDPLTGDLGAREVLYCIVKSSAKQTLLRYDGVSWSRELALPDYTSAAGHMQIGVQAYGPWVMTTRVEWDSGVLYAMTRTPWGRWRRADGTWATVTWNWAVAPGVAPWQFVPQGPGDHLELTCLTNWQGQLAVFCGGVDGGANTYTLFLTAVDGVFVTPNTAWRQINFNTHDAVDHTQEPLQMRWCGQTAYLLMPPAGPPPAKPFRATVNCSLWSYNFVTSTVTKNYTVSLRWIENCGGRIYAGTNYAGVNGPTVYDATSVSSPTVVWHPTDLDGYHGLDTNETFSQTAGMLPIAWVPQVDAGDGVGAL